MGWGFVTSEGLSRYR